MYRFSFFMEIGIQKFEIVYIETSRYFYVELRVYQTLLLRMTSEYTWIMIILPQFRIPWYTFILVIHRAWKIATASHLNKTIICQGGKDKREEVEDEIKWWRLLWLDKRRFRCRRKVPARRKRIFRVGQDRLWWIVGEFPSWTRSADTPKWRRDFERRSTFFRQMGEEREREFEI